MANYRRTDLDKTRRLVALALFTAIVVVLQLLGSFIRFGTFSISLVLVPIVIGAVLYGPWAGAFLGAVFGLVVLLSGDAAAFLVISPLGCILTVMLKGALSGLCAGLVYRLLHRANEYAAIVAAAIVCPVVNTGVFLLGCLAFWGAFAARLAASLFGWAGRLADGLIHWRQGDTVRFPEDEFFAVYEAEPKGRFGFQGSVAFSLLLFCIGFAGVMFYMLLA